MKANRLDTHPMIRLTSSTYMYILFSFI